MVEATIKISDKHEGTSAPYWLIIDPRQMLEPDPHTVASMVTGPFFSRESAEQHLSNRSYEFSDKAIVYCHSGWQSKEYSNAWNKARTEHKRA